MPFQIIDEDEADDRLIKAKQTGTKHFYLFKVNRSMVIDAGPMGSTARFINHSCDPNCVAQKWTVGSQIRVGIFAKQDLQPGVELSYDYNWVNSVATLADDIQVRSCI